ncbi:outer membrane channel protein TolC [Ferrimonas gelatinilytica]|uniref:Outer membrane channel protein TolC n=1 Tax=Ferrimonas gelatinilytica TaxID=1255257 RepID=A0ABP9S2M2_9GAMM
MSASPTQADDLIQIYQQALSSDPVLLQARADLDASYQTLGQSRANLLPQINASLGYGNTFKAIQPSQEVSGYQAGLSLSQSIYDHANYVSLDITKQQISQAELRFEQQKQGLIQRVAKAYFDVLFAEDSLAFTRANTRAIQQQLEQTQQRFSVGLTAITDVHEAQAQFDLAKANEINAENALANQREALSEITGLTHDTLSPLDTQRFSPSMPTPARADQWVTLAEQSSQALLSDKLAVEIARQQIALAKTGHLPSMSLTANLDQNFGWKGEQNGVSGNLAVQVDVPIFSGFSVSSQIKQAQYDFAGSQQRLEETHRSLVRSLRNELNNVSASLSSIRAFEQSVVSAESALKATEAGFEVGTRTIVDVLDATRRLYNAKQQLADARYRYILSSLALKGAAGSLSEQDIALVNQGLSKR